jgi:drug/metabolite transporter (DMT)-like permease
MMMRATGQTFLTATTDDAAAAFLYLSPLFSAAFSIGWLGEQLAWYHIAGIAAIFSGLIIMGRKPSQYQAAMARLHVDLHQVEKSPSAI